MAITSRLSRRKINPARDAARQAGERTYRDSRVCIRGHDPIRYTSGGGCVACLALSNRHPDRKYKRAKATYGISKDEYVALWSAQGERCRLCPATAGKMCVDHCHETGRVRGILCQPCNIIIGSIDRNRDRLPDLIAYAS